MHPWALNGRRWALHGRLWGLSGPPLGPQWALSGPPMGAFEPSIAPPGPPCAIKHDFYYKKALKVKF